MLKGMAMANGPKWQRFNKAAPQESVLKQGPATVAKNSSVAMQANTPRIKFSDLTSEPTYAQQRCRTIDPNHARAPFSRTRAPRATRNRRPSGWTDIWISLPQLTVDGLKQVAITLAQEEQHSPWPKERRRYPRTRSHLVGEALDDFFRKLGFEEFCYQPPQGKG